jgi:hypothetical protein
LTIKLLLTGLALASTVAAQAATVFSENFDSVAALSGAGWVQTNNSDAPAQPWFQGNSGNFAAFNGAADAYAAANFLSSGLDTGAISNWLITPLISLSGANSLSFWARTDSLLYSDGLKISLSPTGSATTADFSVALLNLPALTTSWTKYTVALPGFASATGTRIAFEYNVTSAVNADYLGLDNVVVTSVPEPTSALLLGLGLAGFVIRRRLIAV